jgi:hypothetical protein
MSDLVRGRYPVTNPLAKALGLQSNVAQGNLSVRSNAEWFGGFAGLTDGALAATGVACAVPVPVEIGDTITKISIVAGATAEATGTHAFAMLYTGLGVPALIGQSVDNVAAAAIGASTRFDFTLATPQAISQAQAPGGFLYASIMVAAGTIPTVASYATPAGINYQWFNTQPLFWSMTHGSGLTTTAPATIASPAAKAVAPLVFLY